MLNNEQVDRLNKVLTSDDLPRNPLLRIIVASERANLALEDVLEHLIVQLCLKAADCGSRTRA